jgi:hypothetical protein
MNALDREMEDVDMQIAMLDDENAKTRRFGKNNRHVVGIVTALEPLMTYLFQKELLSH